MCPGRGVVVPQHDLPKSEHKSERKVAPNIIMAREIQLTFLMFRYMTAHLSQDLEGLATFWNSFHGPKYSLAKTKMMVRPNNYKDNL